MQLRRWLLIGYGVLMALLVTSFISALLGLLWPLLFNSAPAILAFFTALPLWLRVLICAGLLAALLLLFRLWRGYVRVKQADEQKKAKELLSQQGGVMAGVVDESLKPVHTKLEEINLRLEGTVRTLPPGVVAPAGLPLAASLIGRDGALADLMTKLREGTTSGVFALEGMGGVGKSALATEAVSRLAEDLQAFPGGAAWIACEGLEGEAGLADLWARVARALHLEQVAAQTDPQAQGKRLLLALDNIEPGLDAETLLETLAVRSRTALLLTARQKVAPQRVFAIDLAPLPPDDSRALFLERLAQAGGATPTLADEEALAALLASVGGLPLALELTAAYAGVQRLSLAAVARELEQDGLHALAFGDAKRDPKRALLKRFERSWAALTPRQQCLFAGLSLLARASFPREAAQALAAAAEEADAPASEDDPGADLPTLVSYALVKALPGGERLRLHPLLREYAAGKLRVVSQEQQARLGDAMVAFWLAYARAHPGYAGIDALEAEAAGLLGALAWAHEEARHREVLGLAKAILRTWNVRGRRDEELQLYAWSERAAQELGDVLEQRWAAHQLSATLGQTGRLAEARAGYERALAFGAAVGRPGSRAGRSAWPGGAGSADGAALRGEGRL